MELDVEMLMDPHSLLSRAATRHELTRMPRLVSYFELGGGTSVILTTHAETVGGRLMVTATDIKTGAINPIIGSCLVVAQDRIDRSLGTWGKEWEEAWHEAALLSVICDSGNELLLGCRASTSTGRRVGMAIDQSCTRVRTRLSSVSSELPRLAVEVQAICAAPAARAA